MYNGITGMLGSDKGKEAQREYASQDTQKAIDDLINNYGITNPAVIIFVADIMNQYGNGIPATKQAAANACKGDNNVIGGLDKAITAIKGVLSSYNTYSNRRSKTYNYLKNLDSQGKFSEAGLTDQGEAGNSVAGNGQYAFPVRGHILISADWGGGGAHGYSSSAHNGIDLACSTGTKIYACTDGTVTYKSTSGGFGNHVMQNAADGNLIVYGHMSAFNGGNRTVKKGDLIGYVGSTGNSTGPHLHLGITSSGESGLYNANWQKGKNPASFLGIPYQKNVYIDM